VSQSVLIMSNRFIINKLISACTLGKPYYFLPYLFLNVIQTNMPNKIRFYYFFVDILRQAHKSKKSALKLVKEPIVYEGGNETNYSFYDSFHRGPRISIIIREEQNKIYLTTLPF